MKIGVTTLADRPDLLRELHDVNNLAWPAFMLQWRCPAWSHLYTAFAGHQLLLLDEQGSLAAFGHTIPLSRESDPVSLTGDLKTLIEDGVNSFELGLRPNLLLALAAVVSPRHKGKGLSFTIVRAMKNLARGKGLAQLIVPVRPTLKAAYPLIPIEKYARWKRADGLPFDPWLRVHSRLGGSIYKTTAVSMTIRGTVEEWETWTGRMIPASGSYIFDGALNPVCIDYGNDTGCYTDPCIWVRYDIPGSHPNR